MLTLTADKIRANAIKWERTPGIYFLLCREEIVYVGKSKNIFPRVLTGEHGAKPRSIEFDSWFWIPCPLTKLDATEEHYIIRFNPRCNRDIKTKRRRGIEYVSNRRPGRIPKRIVTPTQTFDSPVEAAKVHGISRQAIYLRVKSRWGGWHYEQPTSEEIRRRKAFDRMMERSKQLPLTR